jgi:SPP1 gp7 family putative phage head morphogenesis protein
MPTKPRKLDPVSNRLRARLHQKSIDAIDYQEAAAEACKRVAARYARRVINALPFDDIGHTLTLHRIQAIAKGFWPDVARMIYDRLLAMHKWSAAETKDILLDVVPPHWWRKVVPQLSRLKEATVNPQAGFGFPPIVPPAAVSAPAPDDPDDENKQPEPVIPRMSDDEWQEIASQVLFPPPSEQTLRDIIYGPGVGGEAPNWPARLGRWSKQYADPDKLANMIASEMSQGADLKSLAKTIKDEYQGASSAAARVARSEAHRVNLVTQQRSFNSLGDLQTGQMYQATLDMNVRPWHAIHHGQVFHEGEPLPDTLDEPNCRCWLTPVLGEPEELDTDPELASDFANAADEEIPDPSAYDQWFSQASEQERRLAVGGNRYRAVSNMLNREPEWTDFLSGDDGNLASVAKLQAESEAERAARKASVDTLIQTRAKAYKQIRNVGFLLGV